MAAIKLEDLPRYTYEDYKEWEGRWEVISGVAYAMSPTPDLRHQRISQRIAYELGKTFENYERCKAYLPVDWVITEDTIVQPDNLVVCDEKPWTTKLKTTPSIIFEVISRSSAHKDRAVKYSLYEEAGVKYYILVYPSSETATLFYLQNKKFLEVGEFKNETYNFIVADCEFEFDFGGLWK